MEIQNNAFISYTNNNELNKYYTFNDDFTFTITSKLPNNECYVYKTNYYSNTLFLINEPNYIIKTNNIFPYYISYSKDNILPDVIYKINFINDSITQILINPEKKSILIRICDKYNKIYNKGIACNSRKTPVSNILEQLLRIDIDNRENTIEKEIAGRFEIEMYGSAN